MVQSIDRMLGRLRAEAGPNTYFFLTSDNGFHLGQLQLNGGKGTPYDFDTHVPLVVAGPGVQPGPAPQFVSSIDLAPTFETHRRAAAEVLRRARLRLQPGQPAGAGGRFVFMEHTYAKLQPGEVDSDRPPEATSSRCRRTSRCGGSTVCWRASTSTTPARGTDYA